MKTLIAYLVLAACGGAMLASAAPAAAANVTVGNFDAADCSPFNCNDSGTNVGQTMAYQEVYLGTAVGSRTFNQITFYADPNFNTPSVLGGSYNIIFGTTTAPLSSTAPLTLSNVATFANVTLSSAFPVTSSWTITGTPYTFSPAEGNLVMEVVAKNQDLVPNGSGNGYFWADTTSGNVGRGYQFTTRSSWEGLFTTGLVTTFSFASSAPGPVPGTGLAGLAALALAGLYARRA